MKRRAIVIGIATTLAIGGAFVMLAIRPTQEDLCRDWVARYPDVAEQHGIESCDEEVLAPVESFYYSSEAGDPPAIGLPNLYTGSAFERAGFKWELVGYIVWLFLVLPVALLIVRVLERVGRRT